MRTCAASVFWNLCLGACLLACSGTISVGPEAEDGRDAGEDDGGPVEDDGAPVEDDGGSVEDDGGSVQDDGGPVEDDGGSVEDDGGSVQDDGGSVEDDGGSVQDDGGSVQDDGGSVQDDGGPVQDDGGPCGPCDDSDECTLDSCDPVAGCQHSPAPDWTSCGPERVCWAGACLELGCRGNPPAPAGCDTWGVPRALGHARCQPAGACDGGDEPLGASTPSWRERAFVTLVNAARAAPVAYRDRYMSFRDTSGANVFDSNPGPRQPMAWHHVAAQAARFHATDRTGCTTAQVYAHSLCDGTAFATWSGWFLSGAGEVFFEWPQAARPELVLGIVNGFICDGSTWDMAGYPGQGCVTDDSSAAGHRRLLVLNTSYRQLGAGFARTGNRTEWSGVPTSAAPPPWPPAAWGAHFFHGNQIVFGLNVSASEAPLGVWVVLDGQARPLALVLGEPALGFHALSQTPAAGCRAYYFVLQDAQGRLWRHPATGLLSTTLEGGCSQDFLP
jgi:hypothetical protein